jgi:hypothetical protein
MKPNISYVSTPKEDKERKKERMVVCILRSLCTVEEAAWFDN